MDRARKTTESARDSLIGEVIHCKGPPNGSTAEIQRGRCWSRQRLVRQRLAARQSLAGKIRGLGRARRPIGRCRGERRDRS